jgi:N-sulfoglucosamine sulfohydrolase
MRQPGGRSWLAPVLSLLWLLARPAAPAPAQEPAQRPNFVVIIADDMGWEDSSAYGHPTIRTPTLARLAREGIRFDQAFVTTSSCSPSRASIMTGRYPHNTGAAQLHQPVPTSQVTFVELLRGAGYWTAAAGKWHLGDALRDRFDLVKDAGRLQAASAAMPGGGDVSGAEEWLETMRERPRDRPFFLWLAAFDPHREYREGAVARPHLPGEVVMPPYLPDTPEVRADLALYYDEIARLDGHVGEVLDELERQGVADNTFVLFLSDNGQPFPRAKTTVYDSGIRTPFLVRWPAGVRPGRVSSRLVSTVDIAPTLLDLAGVRRPATFQGTSFAPLLADPGAAVREYVFAEKNWHDFDDRVRAARSDRYKLVRNDYPDVPNGPPADAVRSPTFRAMRRMRDAGTLTPAQGASFVTPRLAEELYDLWADPYELRNLAGDPRYAATLERMRGVLDAWGRDTDDARPAERTPDGFDRETGEALPPRAPTGR